MSKFTKIPNYFCPVYLVSFPPTPFPKTKAVNKASQDFPWDLPFCKDSLQSSSFLKVSYITKFLLEEPEASVLINHNFIITKQYINKTRYTTAELNFDHFFYSIKHHYLWKNISSMNVTQMSEENGHISFKMPKRTN